MTARLDTLRTWSWLPLGAALGLAIAWSVAAGQSLLAAAALTAALLGLVILRNPEIGALLIIVLVGIVPRGVLFNRGLPFGGGNLKVTDLLLAATLASWCAGRVVRPARFPLPSRSVTVLILTFLALASLGLLTAHQMGTPHGLSLLELRPLLSFLLVFPLVSGARSWRQFDRGLSTVLAVAAVSAFVAVAEYVRGTGGAATFTNGALRVQATVYLLPLVALIWAPVLIAYVRAKRTRAALVGLAILSVTGVYFTFARGAWVALLFAAPVVVVLLPPRRRNKTLRWLGVLTIFGVGSLLAVNTLSARRVPDPLTAGLRRIESVGNFRADVSSRYRFAEWSEAIRQIERHPLTGIGLGSSITFTNPMFSSDYNTYGYTYSTYYIHSSYIWFALKLGFLGALVFFSLIAQVCRLAYRGYRQVDDLCARPVLLGALGSLIAILVLSATGPHLSSDNATPIVAALIAAVEIARRLSIPSGQGGGA